MTERRPHWTDDLIEAVRVEIDAQHMPPNDIYRVIAAVEDWLIESVSFTADQPRAVSALQEKRRKAEATIQRVRELAHNALLGTDAGMGYPHVSAEDILRALDGE